jgi:hypothetical protein
MKKYAIEVRKPITLMAKPANVSGMDVDTDYSDIALFYNDIEWIVFGSEFVKRK